MRSLKTKIVLSLLVLGLVAGAAMADGRQDKILANIKLAYPQLEQMQVQMGEIKPSGFDGLDIGTFTMQGNRTQEFLVSTDDTKLYLTSGPPIDVSKSADEINKAIAERKQEETLEAKTRMAKLDASVEGLPFRGNPDAKVTIIEFSDFQCPFCSRGADTMEEVLEKYPNDVKFVFKHFPLGFHPWAKPAAIATHCAAQQDHEAFWTLHDKYFEKQKEITPENVIAKSKEFLADSGIDLATFATCADDKSSAAYEAAAAVVDADVKLGGEHGVSGTPGFFVNGRFLNGAQPIAAFEPLIEEAKKDTK